jgi:hypothetical protein
LFLGEPEERLPGRIVVNVEFIGIGWIDIESPDFVEIDVAINLSRLVIIGRS